MNALVHVAEDDDGNIIVLVDWEGFNSEERTWESLRKIHSSAPEFVVKELRKLRLTRALTSKLASEYDISLLFDACQFGLVILLVVKLVRLS